MVLVFGKVLLHVVGEIYALESAYDDDYTLYNNIIYFLKHTTNNNLTTIFIHNALYLIIRIHHTSTGKES